MQTNQYVSVYDAMAYLEQNWSELTKPQKSQYERLVHQRIKMIFAKQKKQQTAM